MRRFTLAVLLVTGVFGCRETEPEQLLRATEVTDQNDLIGGPLAHGQIGDFLIENDKVRYIITGAHHSWGPGLFGGTVVDADRRRAEPFYRGSEGNDHFAELFPTVNILVPDPTKSQIRVANDGSDGTAAVIEMEGTGLMFLESLEILDPTGPGQYASLLANADLKTVLDFKTVYTLKPGDDFLKITTTVTRPDSVLHNDENCGKLNCDLECEHGLLRDRAEGCLICECDPGLPMTPFTEPIPLLARILGGVLASGEAPGLEAGLIGGDFMFFGGGTDIFAPGIGFDEKGEIFANLFRGIDTITSPLTFDWVAGAADDVTYAVFTRHEDECADCDTPQLLLPLATSSATMIVSAGISCLMSDEDDETCDKHRTFSFTRYLVVGEGDVSSAAASIYKAQGTPTGAISGVVWDSRFGSTEPRADVFALRDPDPSKTFTSYDAIVLANLANEESPRVGVMNQALADLGTDEERNGQYAMTLPVGSYYLVARSRSGSLGPPVRVDVAAGGEQVVHLLVAPPAVLDYRILGEGGGLMPAKLTLQALCEAGSAQEALGICKAGELMAADGRRRVALGDGRLDDGIFKVVYSAAGQGKEQVEPGHYRVVISRGLEYGVYTEDVVLRAGEVTSLAALLPREMDTSGFISGDFHLHAQASHDSGMSLAVRVLTNIVEGVELLSSSDHDVITDYEPALLKLGLEAFATTQIGLEITTIEMGHYLGFPLKYDETLEPTKGAIDWVCKTHQELFDEIRALGEFGPENTINVVAHPRDGFLGYFDQFDLNPWTSDRGSLGLESNNPLFKTLSCDFDAIELLNGKRFELIRTPTVSEVNDAQFCLDEILAATDHAAVRASCEWLRKPASCDGGAERRLGEPCSWYADAAARFETCRDGETLEACKDKARNALTTLMVRRMVYRTPEEQLAYMDSTEDQRDSDKTECNPDNLPKNPDFDEDNDPPESQFFKGDQLAAERSAPPCAQHQGVADDWFALLNNGLNVTAIGNSDSHGTTAEPGLPRTWVASSTDDAGRIDKLEIAKNMKAGKAIASTGPFVRFEIGDATIGGTTSHGGGKVKARIQVQTASWFGVSRIEIYRNGTLAKGIDIDPAVTDIIDFDEVVELDEPAEDSWYVVTAVGLRDQDFLDPVYHTEALGHITFDKITALAFANLGVIGGIIGGSSLVVDYFPTLPYAITNPIYVDVDGSGYKAPGDRALFCPTACEKDADCPREGDICHDNKIVHQPGPGGTCGPDIIGRCALEPEETSGLEKKEGELKVSRGAHPLASLRAQRNQPRDEELLQHSLGRYLWNAFVHGPHAQHK